MMSFVASGQSRTLSKCLCNLIVIRAMGGGPRTFPGGVNKWKWKRMHEKRARDKERRLLLQEKQLYQARIRSHIRSHLSPNPDATSSPPTHSPMGPTDHIKALADRFMKEGAEDLWNPDDGPLKFPPLDRRRELTAKGRAFLSGGEGFVNRRRELTAKGGAFLSLGGDFLNRRRELTAEGGAFLSGGEAFLNRRRELTAKGGAFLSGGGGFGVNQRRGYSRKGFQRNESSSEEEEDSVGPIVRDSFSGKKSVVNANVGPNLRNSFSGRRSLVNASVGPNVRDSFSGKRSSENDNVVRRQRRVWRDDSCSSGSDLDDDCDGLRKKIGGSSASLGKYDVKISRRRVPLKCYDEESDLSDQVELIRYELNKRKMAENEQQKSEEDTLLSEKRFDECGISPLTIKALSSAGYIRMTRVQEATLSACLECKDVLVKAKTGTGKSAAFLLPAIETVLKAMSINAPQRVPPVLVLILCPTRELAIQLTAELKVLLKYHDGIGVQTLIGGIRFKDDQKRLESDPSQIIVATPGRLLDHIEYKSGISVRLMGLQMLILDEADHLLDLGFRKSVEKLVDCLPRQRQSLLFSATIPKEVRRISQLVLKRDHMYIDTVGMSCVETPVKIKQSYLIAPHESHFQIVHHILKEHILQAPDYKVIVFCVTGMVTSLLYQLLRDMKMNVREIHSRKPQLYRTRISDEFRESKQLILISSDVSSRGMNYPDVSLVIQVGIPTDREQYIHRVGRTGREGKEGECILLIAPWEEYFLDEIKDLPLTRFPLPDIDPEAKLKVGNSMAKIDNDVKESAYHTWLGYYNSIREIGRDKTTLAELANLFSESIGLQRPPSLFRRTALKMGLKDIPGIRIRR